MKRWKRRIGIVLVVLCVLCLTGTALAETIAYERVYDMAHLFSGSEKRELSDAMTALREKMDMDVAIVTTDENDGTAEEFADAFYYDNGLGTGKNADGVLFLFDMENRELWICPVGTMTRYLTDSRQDAILDDIYEYASEGNFYGAAKAFVEDVEICYDNGIAGDQYNQDVNTGKISRYHTIAWYEVLIAFAVAAACGGAAVFSVVREYGLHGDETKLAANFKLSYRKDSAFKLGNILADVLIGSYVTQMVIQSAKNNSGSGHSSGGLKSGGRTSTHSYRGQTHGGRGRKF